MGFVVELCIVMVSVKITLVGTHILILYMTEKLRNTPSDMQSQKIHNQIPAGIVMHIIQYDSHFL